MKIYKEANNCCIRDFIKWITLQNKNPKIPDKLNRTKTAKKKKKERKIRKGTGSRLKAMTTL